MTTKEKILHITNVILIVAVIILSIFLHKSCSVEQPEPIVITDTVTVTEFVDKIKYVTQYDTVVDYKFVSDITHDTITLRDTVRIPIEYKTSEFTIKKDSFEGNGVVHYHGFKADVDSINFDYKFTYTPPKQKNYSLGWTFAIGVTGGYGLNLYPDGTYKPGGFIGVGGTVGIGLTKKFGKKMR